ncbi:MAG: universal stress protein [Acidobacteria bacterium]|nr:universal stress protein [Acidobacteriota bacterium]
MINLKRILFPTDFSECARHAFSYALDLARLFNAELHILHAIVNHTYAGYFSADQENLYKSLRKNAEYLMEDLIEKYPLDSIKVEKLYFPALSASSMIIDYAGQSQIDLIVMGTHGRQGLSHLMLGSVAENVIRTANCPVLTVGKDADQNKDASITSIKNILVPIDFSEHSKKSLTYAIELAKNYKATLQLLHIIDTPIYPAFYVVDQLATTSIASNIKTRVLENLSTLLKSLGECQVNTEIHALEGRATTDIVKFASENNSDLIVIATHGLTGVERFLLGSVTEKVVRIAKTPVFTVKPHGRQMI